MRVEEGGISDREIVGGKTPVTPNYGNEKSRERNHPSNSVCYKFDSPQPVLLTLPE
jgi:hypothetical protein